jgi:hypothetical protein
MPVCPRRNHYRDATRLEQRYETVSVIGLIGNHCAYGLIGDPPLRLGHIRGLTPGKRELPWLTQRVGHGMDLGTEAAARAPQGFGLGTAFLAPAAQAWARTPGLSSNTSCKSGSAATCRCRSAHTPRSLQRAKRLNTLFQFPRSGGSRRRCATPLALPPETAGSFAAG